MKHDYSLDFIKGIAILSVIFLHNLPNYYILSTAWIGQAVPLFILVTSYLTYSSFERGKTSQSYFSIQGVKKMFWRIFFPFFLLIMIQIVLYALFIPAFNPLNIIKAGGIGKGSYYPWIYLQFWIMFPFIVFVIDKVRNCLKRNSLSFDNTYLLN